MSRLAGAELIYSLYPYLVAFFHTCFLSRENRKHVLLNIYYTYNVLEYSFTYVNKLPR